MRVDSAPPLSSPTNAHALASQLEAVLGGKSFEISQAETTPSVVVRSHGEDWRALLSARAAVQSGQATPTLTWEHGADMVEDTVHLLTHNFDERVMRELHHAVQLLQAQCHSLNVVQAENNHDGVITLVTVLYGTSADNKQIGIVFAAFAEYC